MDIRETVKNLLAMASHEGSNENEARVALLKAKEIMAKHKLTEADFSEKAELVHEICEGVQWTTDSGEVWVNTLSQLLAENYLCAVAWRTRKGARTHVLVLTGLKSDVEVCKSMIEYAVGFVRGQVKYLQRKQSGNPKTIARSYAEGFCQGLDLWFDLQKDQHPEWGLVMVKSDEVRDYESSLGNKSVRVHAPTIDALTFMKGKNDGLEFNKTKVLTAN